MRQELKHRLEKVDIERECENIFPGVTGVIHKLEFTKCWTKSIMKHSIYVTIRLGFPLATENFFKLPPLY